MLRSTPFARYAAAHLEEPFTLIDIGCRDGLLPGWRVFGEKLRAEAFDPDIGEIERLRARETLAGVRYTDAFVAIPPDHPFKRRAQGHDHVTRNPWDRLAIARSLSLNRDRIREASEEERSRANLWQTVRLANPQEPVYLLEYLATHEIDDVDFFKIDIDGADFEVLNSLDDFIAGHTVLGFLHEVNYYGSEAETEHTFHNTDRFMRTHGYDLFDLSVRHYASASLPSAYASIHPGPSFSGRPYQGDALYLLDAGAPHNTALVSRLSESKLLKLAALFSLFELPGSAAEVLLAGRERLDRVLPVSRGLDLLARQSQRELWGRKSYAALMQAFERGSRRLNPAGMVPLFAAVWVGKRGARILDNRVRGWWDRRRA